PRTPDPHRHHLPLLRRRLHPHPPRPGQPHRAGDLTPRPVRHPRQPLYQRSLRLPARPESGLSGEVLRGAVGPLVGRRPDAEAAGVAGCVADGITAAGAVEVGVAGWAVVGVVGVVAGGCVAGGAVVGGVVVVVVALGSMTRTTPHIPSSWPLLSEPSWLKLE